MAKKSSEGSVSKKTKMNRGQLRELFTEQMMRAVESRGFVEELFKILDDIKDPDKKLRCALEMMKFVMPQLASQRIELANEQVPVSQLIFSPSPPALKAANSNE